MSGREGSSGAGSGPHSGRGERSGWSRVAVVRGLDGGGWRVVVVCGAGGGGARVERSEVVGDAEGVRRVVMEGGAERAVRVVGSGAVVSRVVEMPRVDGVEAGEAIGLLAEASLPSSVPAWRRGGCVLGGGASEGMLPVLVAGWVVGRGEAESVDGALAEAVGEGCVTHVPLAACLAAMVEVGGRSGGGGGVGGAARGCAVLHEGDGGLAVVGYGERATVVRSAVVGGDGGSAVGVERELAAVRGRVGAGGGGAVVGGDGSAGWLAVDGPVASGLASAVEGARGEGDWLAGEGVCAAVGAVLVGGGVVGASAGGWRSVCGLRRRASPEPGGGLERLVSVVNRRGVAAAMLLFGVVALVAVPPLASWARAERLEGRVAAYESALGIGEDGDGLSDEERTRLYAVLDRYRLPMTKVLADIGAALPAEDARRLALADRVTVEAGERFRVEGTAEPAGLVNEFQAKLQSSGVFGDVRVESLRSPAEPGARAEFVVSGEVERPYSEARGLRDYAANDAQAFVYGEVTDASIAAAAREAEEAERRAREASRAEAVGGGDGGGAGSGGGVDGEAVAAGGGVGASEGAEGSGGPRSGRRSEGSRRPAVNESIARDMEESGGGGALASDEEIEEGRRRLFEGGSGAERDAAAPTPVPDELSEADIAAMDNLDAMKARIARQKALRERDDLEGGVRQRLEDEAARLLDRAREAREESR